MVQRIRMSREGPGSKAEPADGMAGGALHDVRQLVSRGCRDLQSTLAKGIRRRPLTAVLATLGVGFLIGRYRVRPVETVVLACGTGLIAGLVLSKGCAGGGDLKKEGGDHGA